MTDPTHGPVEPEYVERMNQLAHFLDDMFNPKGKPKKTVFVMIVGEVGEGGRMNYISNGERANMVELLTEFLGRVEAG